MKESDGTVSTFSGYLTRKKKRKKVNKNEGRCYRLVRAGLGINKFANGDCYTGQFLNGKANGYGVMLHKGIRFNGYWKGGKLTDIAEVKVKDRICYGEVENWQLIGRCAIVYKDSSLYLGRVNEKFKPHGNGEMHGADGTKYSGYFKQDKHNGYGEFTYKFGEKRKGEWENDKQKGYHEFHDAHGNLKGYSVINEDTGVEEFNPFLSNEAAAKGKPRVHAIRTVRGGRAVQSFLDQKDKKDIRDPDDGFGLDIVIDEDNVQKVPLNSLHPETIELLRVQNDVIDAMTLPKILKISDDSYYEYLQKRLTKFNSKILKDKYQLIAYESFCRYNFSLIEELREQYKKYNSCIKKYEYKLRTLSKVLQSEDSACDIKIEADHATLSSINPLGNIHAKSLVNNEEVKAIRLKLAKLYHEFITCMFEKIIKLEGEIEVYAREHLEIKLKVSDWGLVRLSEKKDERLRPLYISFISATNEDLILYHYSVVQKDETFMAMLKKALILSIIIANMDLVTVFGVVDRFKQLQATGKIEKLRQDEELKQLDSSGLSIPNKLFNLNLASLSTSFSSELAAFRKETMDIVTTTKEGLSKFNETYLASQGLELQSIHCYPVINDSTGEISCVCSHKELNGLSGIVAPSIQAKLYKLISTYSDKVQQLLVTEIKKLEEPLSKYLWENYYLRVSEIILVPKKTIDNLNIGWVKFELDYIEANPVLHVSYAELEEDNKFMRLFERLLTSCIIIYQKIQLLKVDIAGPKPMSFAVPEPSHIYPKTIKSKVNQAGLFAKSEKKGCLDANVEVGEWGNLCESEVNPDDERHKGNFRNRAR